MKEVLIYTEMAAAGTPPPTTLIGLVDNMTLPHGPQPLLVAPVEVDLVMELLLQQMI